jgi:hypothetical protein
MIIIYGHRPYGRVDVLGGEYAQTDFVHVYYLPIVPTQSTWVMPGGDGLVGLPLGLDAKSIAAAYLRIWGVLVATITFCVAPGLVTGLIAAALIGLSAYSWGWRVVRGAHARQRSQFNLLAFGTRCDPTKVSAADRINWKQALEERQSKLPVQRPVEDVARFGASDLEEAAIAYGLLRLAAIDNRSKDAETAVDRLLAGTYDELQTGEGPYRETTRTVELPGVVGSSRRVVTDEPSFWDRPGAMWIAVVALGLFALGSIFQNSHVLVGPREPTLGELRTSPPLTKYVAVDCDSIELMGRRPSESLFACTLGPGLLLVRTTAASLETRVEGTLRRKTAAKWWSSDLDREDVLALVLDTEGHDNDLAWVIAGIVVGSVDLLIVAVLMLRRRRLAK